MKITRNRIVTLAYQVLTTDDGNVVDSTDAERPLHYLHGHNNLIVGLERALENHAAGDKLEVRVAADEAYGAHQEELVGSVPKAMFEEALADELHVGEAILLQTPSGPIPVTVVEIQDDQIIIDANHRLTGRDLNFNVEIMHVREATAKEIAQGMPEVATEKPGA